MRGSHLVAALGIAGPGGRFRLDGLVQKIALMKDFAARPSKSVVRARRSCRATRGTIWDATS